MDTAELPLIWIYYTKLNNIIIPFFVFYLMEGKSILCVPKFDEVPIIWQWNILFGKNDTAATSLQIHTLELNQFIFE